jgi:protein TonB
VRKPEPYGRRRRYRGPNPWEPEPAREERLPVRLDFKLFGASRLRRAAGISILAHLVLCVFLIIGLPWNTRPPRAPIELRSHLVNLSSPRSGSLSVKPPSARAPKPPVEKKDERKVEPKPPKKEPPKPQPKQTTTDKKAAPVPVKKPTTETNRPAPVRAEPHQPAAGDTMRTLARDVAMPGGAEGSVAIGVEGPISQYAYYLQAVRDKIATHWSPPAGLVSGGKQVASMVNFRIDRRGKISASYVEEPSGHGVFDKAGLRAVALAEPLPPLPQDYPGEWLGIHLRFVYREE